MACRPRSTGARAHPLGNGHFKTETATKTLPSAPVLVISSWAHSPAASRVRRAGDRGGVTEGLAGPEPAADPGPLAQKSAVEKEGHVRSSPRAPGSSPRLSSTRVRVGGAAAPGPAPALPTSPAPPPPPPLSLPLAAAPPAGAAAAVGGGAPGGAAACPALCPALCALWPWPSPAAGPAPLGCFAISGPSAASSAVDAAALEAATASASAALCLKPTIVLRGVWGWCVVCGCVACARVLVSVGVFVQAS